jgi:alkylation response protein AidB-like acyl-CoA dehydrogenase
MFIKHPQEIRLLIKTVREFWEEEIKPLSIKLDRVDHREAMLITKDIIYKSSRIGLPSFIVPSDFGGPGYLTYAASAVLEVIAYYDAGIASSIGGIWLGQLPIFVMGALGYYEVWKRWFPSILQDDKDGRPQIWGFAITEPSAGSDYERIEKEAEKPTQYLTRAKPYEDGYKLVGRKIFITNGPIADYLTVFAVVDGEGPDSIACFVVPTDIDGFYVEHVYDKMGQRSSPTAELVFDGVWIPKENLVCNGSLGWNVIEITLAYSRTAVGAIALGIAKRAFDEAYNYAKNRVQGGKPIIMHQTIKWKLSRMLMRIYSAEAFIYTSAKKSEEEFPPSLIDSSLVKAYSSDIAVENALEAIQIYGGYGYMKDLPTEKLLRDAKLIQIYEGTNEINLLTAIESYMDERG